MMITSDTPIIEIFEHVQCCTLPGVEFRLGEFLGSKSIDVRQDGGPWVAWLAEAIDGRVYRMGFVGH